VTLEVIPPVELNRPIYPMDYDRTGFQLCLKLFSIKPDRLHHVGICPFSRIANNRHALALQGTLQCNHELIASTIRGRTKIIPKRKGELFALSYSLCNRLAVLVGCQSLLIDRRRRSLCRKSKPPLASLTSGFHRLRVRL